MKKSDIEKIIKSVLTDSRLNTVVAQIVCELVEKLSDTHVTEKSKTDVGAPKKQPGRKPDWTKSSDNSLRNTHARRIKNGQDIEPALNAELTRRFPGYDPETKKFNRGAKKGLAKLSNRKLKTMFMANGGEPVSDELNNELARRFPGLYDAQARKFTAAPVCGGGKKKSIGKLKDSTIKQMYYKAIKKGGISLELNTELARRFPNYDSKTRTFVNLRGGYRMATSEENAEFNKGKSSQRHVYVAPSAPKVTIYVPKDTDNVSNVVPSNPSKDMESAPIHASAPIVIAPAPKQPVVVKPQTPRIEDLVVTTKLLKVTNNGRYSDVFVNGHRILHNHVDTRLELFLDGTLLGVHGIATDMKNLPEKPTWQIFDTNLKPRTFPQTDWFSKKNVYITSVMPMGDTQLRLFISNKMNVILDKRNVLKIFKITSENEK